MNHQEFNQKFSLVWEFIDRPIYFSHIPLIIEFVPTYSNSLVDPSSPFIPISSSTF